MIWITTANESDLIPNSIRDRFLVLPVPYLTRDKRRAVVRRMIEACPAGLGGFETAVDDEVVSAFLEASSLGVVEPIVRLALESYSLSSSGGFTARLETAPRSLVLLDGQAMLADVDLDAVRLLPLGVEFISQDPAGDDEDRDDRVEGVAAHFIRLPAK